MTSNDLAALVGAPPPLHVASAQGGPAVLVAAPLSEILPPSRAAARTAADDEQHADEIGLVAAPRPPALIFPSSAMTTQTRAPAPAPAAKPATATETEAAPRPRIELVGDAEWCFPLSFRPSADWHTGARYFGARRANGKRRHAGCDLLGPVGTPIHAIADGVLVRGPYRFYEHVDAVEILHGGMIVRYGEILPGSYVGGKTVRKGQPICKIGRLDSGNSMLHFEMYGNGASRAPLTDRARGPFQRRADLIDPTKHLDAWVRHLPR